MTGLKTPTNLKPQRHRSAFRDLKAELLGFRPQVHTLSYFTCGQQFCLAKCIVGLTDRNTEGERLGNESSSTSRSTIRVTLLILGSRCRRQTAYRTRSSPFSSSSQLLRPANKQRKGGNRSLSHDTFVCKWFNRSALKIRRYVSTWKTTVQFVRNTRRIRTTRLFASGSIGQQ